MNFKSVVSRDILIHISEFLLYNDILKLYNKSDNVKNEMDNLDFFWMNKYNDKSKLNTDKLIIINYLRLNIFEIKNFLKYHNCIKIKKMMLECTGMYEKNFEYLTDLESFLKKFSCLEEFDIYTCQMTIYFDKILELLQTYCPNISSISLGAHLITNNNEINSMVNSYPNLKKLSIWNVNSKDSISINNILHKCPNLLDIQFGWANFSNIYYNDNPLNLQILSVDNRSSTELNTIINNCIKLTSVKIIDDNQIDDNFILNLVKRQKKLQNIELRDCKKLTEKSLYLILEECLDLKTLKFGLMDFPINGKSNIYNNTITELNLCSCKNLSDNFVKNMMFPNLVDLSFDCCDTITNEAFEKIEENCPNLLNLDITRSNINENVLKYFSKIQIVNKDTWESLSNWKKILKK